jgi:hypothetical protein
MTIEPNNVKALAAALADLRPLYDGDLPFDEWAAGNARAANPVADAITLIVSLKKHGFEIVKSSP